jgi:hypothetical protein
LRAPIFHTFRHRWRHPSSAIARYAPSGDPNQHVHQAHTAGPGRSLHAQPVVGIFVGTGWINILLTYGSFFRKCSDMIAAGPTNEINRLSSLFFSAMRGRRTSIRKGAVDGTHLARNTILDGGDDKRLVCPGRKIGKRSAKRSDLRRLEKPQVGIARQIASVRFDDGPTMSALQARRNAARDGTIFGALDPRRRTLCRNRVSYSAPGLVGRRGNGLDWKVRLDADLRITA